MARLPRLIVPGLPHLVSQRAQHGQSLGRDDADRLGLLALLAQAARQHGVVLHAFALREQRFDLAATPLVPADLSAMMQAVARRHGAAFNRRHGRSGGLWEGRFRVAVIEAEAWMLHAMSYVERLAGAGAGPWASRSTPALGAAAPEVVDPPAYWALGNTPFEREAAYHARLEQGLTLQQLAKIELALRGGWALGSERFAANLAASAGRPALPRRRGRPNRAAGRTINTSPINIKAGQSGIK